ncbi:MAG: peptidase M48 [Robiginitomaculum sp.]|nr:MAG: peptidase M48 [Robiginitomaculum sp.]
MTLATIAAIAATDPFAATETWMNTMTAEQIARSNGYFVGGYWLQLWNFLISLAVAWVLLTGKRSARMRDYVSGKVPRWLVSPSYIGLYVLITTLLVLPMTVYQDFFREQQYDLMNQTLGDWFGEQMIAFLVDLALSMLAVWGLFALIRKLGAAWRWWGAGATISFMALMIMAAPVYISPLFNDYTPMEEGPLKTEILAMAEANGVPADNVYVFNISKQTDRVTANVSGFMGTTRISLSDTLLERVSPEAVKSVMGHEIGHYALGHIYEMLVNFGLVIFFGYVFTHSMYGWVQRRWGSAWGIGPIGDIAGLPLFFAVLSVYFFITTPVTNSIIRSNEVEADIFGLNASQEPDGNAEVDMMLGEYRKMRPGKWEEILFFDHPSGYNRVLMAMKWKAAHEVIEANVLDNPSDTDE